MKKIKTLFKTAVLAVGLSAFVYSAHADFAPDYVKAQAEGTQTNFVLGGNNIQGATNLTTGAPFELDQSPGNPTNSFAFQTAITAAGAGNSNVVWGWKFSIDYTRVGYADTITWVTNTCNGSNVTVRTLNVITPPNPQARYAVCFTNFTTQTNGVNIATQIGQMRPVK